MPPPTLRARALGLLSRREHSRHELLRKLSPYACESDDIDTLLDELEREGWLSEARVVESLLRCRAPRQGALRLREALRDKGISISQIDDALEGLRATEYERALAVWQRKFGEPAATPQEAAKQARFLAGRGFASEIVARIVRCR